MKKVSRRWGSSSRQQGVSVVLVAVSLLILLGFMALSVDGGNLFVARNELHNAADAGSLAGARFLYTDDGSSVNPGANQIATDAAQANNSQSSPSEVISALRGHWSFANRTFTPNDSLTPVNLSEKSTAELDQYDPFEPFINAVEVVTARQQTQVEAFFGRVLGFEGYDVSARSVAYIGFAGTLRPLDVDQPIALCKQALLNPDGNFSCDMGRFIPDGDQTGGWTNFEHDQSGATNANELRDLVEGDGNENEMYYGEDIATNNGQVQSAFQAFYDRWVNETNRERTWTLTLPVIDCEDGVAPSNRLVGIVTVHVVWAVSNAQENKIDEFAPERMGLELDAEGVEWPGDWESTSAVGQERWDSFVDHFWLRSEDDQPAEWRKMSIYFLPSCDYHEPKGQTGGENYGIPAEIPVLVD
ncbi:pilus assembly protein TadG-related protein [Halomonas sp. EGI 63088]|uniref:Pilus assembly protein TadG-related protein n=1 Tax=Halomonas flagellata TaxID=2920385 RepID=A0ABS9RZ72_9GAMM|nr:pilus assembly protein TadG-related protein [Halomonas flagellata]MCH4565158.1 pilus assembly protein TadG-related protein [Halomonas flagellata]